MLLISLYLTNFEKRFFEEKWCRFLESSFRSKDSTRTISNNSNSLQKMKIFRLVFDYFLSSAISADRKVINLERTHGLVELKITFTVFLNIDLHGLSITITSLHYSTNYHPCTSISHLPVSFKQRKLSGLENIQGSKCLVDALRKNRSWTYCTLNNAMQNCKPGIGIFKMHKATSQLFRSNFITISHQYFSLFLMRSTILQFLVSSLSHCFHISFLCISFLILFLLFLCYNRSWVH